MPIKHASVYEPMPDDAGLRVLVMRQWPRGVRKERIDVWLKDAAPSRELLQAYRSGDLAWPEFESRYRDEVLNQRPAVLQELRQLERRHGTVTLLCFERMPPHAHCHRLILQSVLHDTA